MSKADLMKLGEHAMADMHAVMPLAQIMYDISFEDAMEELCFMAMTGCPCMYMPQAYTPDWNHWFYNEMDPAPMYAVIKKSLQALNWLQANNKRWVLKTPHHLGFLPTLTETFPDCHLIITHRDPASSTVSNATMNAYAFRETHDQPNPKHGYQVAIDMADGMIGGLVRDFDGLQTASLTEIHFHDYMADVMATLETIYAQVDLWFTDQARAELQAYIDAHPRLDHKVVTAENGAQVNADFKAFITEGPWSEVKTVQVAPKIHTIIGYGLSNYTFIEGETGLILIDTGLNNGSGLEILKMKSAFSDKPISAIIYTHHHYTAGSQSIVASYPERSIPIYGHPDVDKYLLSVFSNTATGSFRRGIMQFGHFLPKEGPDAEYGIPEPKFDDPALNARGHLPVSHPVSDGEEIMVDGVRIVFHHAVADTEDSLIIHFPDLDAVVHNTAVMPFLFPMYTLRGDYYRAPPDVLASVDKLRRIKPKYLIGCHGNPVIGEDEVYAFATAHRDALAFVFQQTVQGINLGLEPEEIARRVKLPDAFSETPELFTAYVDVEHMVRGIYRGIIGWWANDPADLHPPAPAELGREIVDGFGGVAPLLARAERVLEDRRYNLAATLATYVLNADPNNEQAGQIKAAALRKMAYATPTGIQTRNFLLTEAVRLEGAFETQSALALAPAILSPEVVAALPPATFLEAFTHTINADAAVDLVVSIRIEFSDLGDVFSLHIRNGAVELVPGTSTPNDLDLTFDRDTWAMLATGRLRLSDAIENGRATFQGDATLMDAFMTAYAQVL
eukprot:g2691.t1